MTAFRSAACLGLLLPIMGIAQVAPAGAVSASPAQIAPLTGSQSTTMQTVHCRRYFHTHRRCLVWRYGVCHRWVTYRHRCG